MQHQIALDETFTIIKSLSFFENPPYLNCKWGISPPKKFLALPLVMHPELFLNFNFFTVLT